MAEVLEKSINRITANMTLVTTAETVVVSSGAVKVPTQTCLVLIQAWAQLTTGAATTTVTPRIRRGTTITGVLVSEANAEAVKAVAGSTEPMFIETTEQRVNEESVEYSLTLAQASATGNGTVLDAMIEVEILNG